jgi:response regulator RpfG family c-di-GMP phosphodiesterase
LPWPKEEAIQYIENQAGKHFDPRIVPEFLDLINANGF